MSENIKKQISASQHESYGLFTFISVIFPLIGIILGIVMLSKDKKLDKKLGEHALAISILFLIIWGVVFAVFPNLSTSTTNITSPPVSTITSSDPIQQSTPSTDLIKITNTSVKEMGSGYYEVVGEAKNTDSVERTFTMKATFYDTSGNIIGTAIGALTAVASNETKTFSLVSGDKIAGYSNYKIQIDTLF